MEWRGGSGEKVHIIQFSHPGAEFNVTADNSTLRLNGDYDVMWNMGRHHRRLVKHAGSYVENGILQNGELVFWTEWEGCTTATKLKSANGLCNAEYLHRVKYPVLSDVGRGEMITCGQNTDPCVFGGSFKYSNCRQDNRPMLRNLQKGSLIAFMSMIHGVYYLDTLFVVGESQKYSTDNANKVDCSEEYRVLTLDRLAAHKSYTFYRGRNFSATAEDNNAIYSFTPAKRYSGIGNQHDFERCALDVDAVNRAVGRDVFTNANLPSIKKTEVTEVDIWHAWNAIVKQTSQKFVLGVHFDWPKATDNIMEA